MPLQWHVSGSMKKNYVDYLYLEFGIQVTVHGDKFLQ